MASRCIGDGNTLAPILAWSALLDQPDVEHHREELFVRDSNPSIEIGVVLTECGGQRLQLHAQLDEVVKGDVA